MSNRCVGFLSRVSARIDTILEALKGMKLNTGLKFHKLSENAQRMSSCIDKAWVPPRIVKWQNYRRKGSASSAESYLVHSMLHHFYDEISNRFGNKVADAFLLQVRIPNRLREYWNEIILEGQGFTHKLLTASRAT